MLIRACDHPLANTFEKENAPQFISLMYLMILAI
jgi:hypothetical protein